MKLNKKLVLSFTLICGLALVFGLSACGSKNKKDNSESENESNNPHEFADESQIIDTDDTQTVDVNDTQPAEQNDIENVSNSESAEAEPKYQTLVWSEEFEDSIDTGIWGYEIGYRRNHELQYYTDREENTRIEDGNLIIEARKEEYEGYAYTSASLNTKGKKDFLYGKLEMRAKLPKGKGIWPAFWAMGISGGWPDGGEIDIMEMIGGTNGDKTVYVNLHYKKNGAHAQISNGNSYTYKEAFGEDYHIFGMIWDEKSIEFYVDDQVIKKCDITSSDMDCFRQPQYILINLAVGGDWPGAPNDTTVFPQQYAIDWIRYYSETTLKQ